MRQETTATPLYQRAIYVLLILTLAATLFSLKMKRNRLHAHEAAQALRVELCRFPATADAAALKSAAREALRRSPSDPSVLIAHQLAIAAGGGDALLTQDQEPIVQALAVGDYDLALQHLEAAELSAQRRGLIGELLRALDGLKARGCEP